MSRLNRSFSRMNGRLSPSQCFGGRPVAISEKARQTIETIGCGVSPKASVQTCTAKFFYSTGARAWMPNLAHPTRHSTPVDL
jgi:hypothetical protein